mgnify:FL=1
MGYGYGVWLVYNNTELKTEHIGHITIACFMNKDNALNLYRDITNILGDTTEVEIIGKPEYFPSSYYEHDTNKLCAWGYYGKCNKWELYKNICDNYECDFSSTPHISKEYNLYPNLLKPCEIENKVIQCKVHCADIRSDFPVDWKLLS